MAAQNEPERRTEVPGANFPPLASGRMDRLPPYLFGSINALKMKLRRAGNDVIDLGMGNPNDPTPPVIVDKLREAVGDKRNQRYSVSQGIFNLRKEFSLYYERTRGVALNPESEVIATLGSKEGFSHLCLAILGPGDLVLTPTPTFPIHIYGPVIAGANVVGVSMEGSDEQLLKRIADMCVTISPRPKVVVLNFPHNPTTRVVELSFFEEVVKLARRYGFYIIHDYAYGLTTYDGYQAPSILQVPGAIELAAETFTMSKGYNMAGWRIGFTAGNKKMIKLLADIKGYYDYGVFQAVQIATVIALRHCDEAMKAQSELYQQRRDVLCDGLNRSGWSVTPPKATMFVWARIPEAYRSLGSIEFATQCLSKADVAVSPGLGFGDEGEGYVRIALVENEERLKQAVRQMRRAFPCEG
ncbi:MAG TPA: aminotransferase class I/II-fold pyridoxal phosphate-dependent enzyme [Bacteroidota bacterium]|nr:aminotransferase class I/II-fold pyridoxal phosphate-dependent enzyme [Bacteroidota bacterium]